MRVVSVFGKTYPLLSGAKGISPFLVRNMLKMPVMHKLDCRISDPSSYWGELGPREYVRRYYGGTGECEVEVVVL